MSAGPPRPRLSSADTMAHRETYYAHRARKQQKQKIKLEGRLENAHCAESSSKLICLASLENGEVLIWVSGTRLLRHQEAAGGEGQGFGFRWADPDSISTQSRPCLPEAGGMSERRESAVAASFISTQCGPRKPVCSPRGCYHSSHRDQDAEPSETRLHRPRQPPVPLPPSALVSMLTLILY